MRNLILVAAFLTAGCAGSGSKSTGPKPSYTPPKTVAMAPHSQVRKYQQQEEKRTPTEGATKVEGAAVIR